MPKRRKSRTVVAVPYDPKLPCDPHQQMFIPYHGPTQTAEEKELLNKVEVMVKAASMRARPDTRQFKL